MGNNDEVKPGIKSTELWFITILGSAVALWQQIEGNIPPPWGTIVMAALGATYTISRAWVKSR